MANSNLNILHSSLGLLLFLLSAASFAPILLLRTPPTSFGRSLLAISSATLLSSISSATLLSSLIGFLSHLTHHQAFFFAHISLILFSSAGQALCFFSLSLRPEQSIQFLKSARNARDTETLVRIVEGMMGMMFVVSSIVLVLECMVRGYEEVDAETSRKSGRRTARVQVVSVAEVEVARDMDERTKCQQSARAELQV